MAELDKDVQRPVPGQVIAPGSALPATPVAVPTPPPAPVATTPPPQPAAPAPAKADPAPQLPPVPVPPVVTRNDDDAVSVDEGGVTWTASEFVAHEKSANWYLSFAGSAILLGAVIFLLTRDFVSLVVVFVAAVVMGIYASRKPRQLTYRIDEAGIAIGPKHFGYEEFRSFSIMPEGAFSSIVLLPLKRFSPLTTIYFAPDDEDTIVDMLVDRLPFEDFKFDAVDRLMRRIRF